MSTFARYVAIWLVRARTSRMAKYLAKVLYETWVHYECSLVFLCEREEGVLPIGDKQSVD